MVVVVVVVFLFRRGLGSSKPVTAMGFRNLGLLGSFAKEGLEKAFSLGKFFCFLHVTDTYLVTFVVTSGPSMLPTIDLIPTMFFGERISTRFGKVTCGDIVIIRSPQNPRKLLAKRLVGMEDDTVTYISNPDEPDKQETIVGDNAYKSNDSRNFGAVPYGLIQHRLFWRVWPIKGFGPFWKH
ncbi:mitochondrial ATP-independent inner membrane protease subunit 1b isoform X3 [Arachis hypogaea]|uniref:mitochondrial ATP-independent inner membrane protease subunit 1b isoform X3 n=2 Tax=Arachis hypogaea TaxID=3818 RepID=UPI000DED27F7